MELPNKTFYLSQSFCILLGSRRGSPFLDPQMKIPFDSCPFWSLTDSSFSQLTHSYFQS